jgi:hypothetical protein
MNFDAILQGYSEQTCRMLRREKLRRVFAPYCLDGTEIHCAIDHALPGLENEKAATRIKSAAEAKYHDTVRLDIIIEIAAELLDEGEVT